MTAQTTEPAAASQIQHLRFVRGATRKLLEDFPQERLCEQTESCKNHALWIAGHIAVSEDFFLKEFGGLELALPKSWNELFGMGSEPVADADRYPSFDEVMKALDERHEAAVKWLESLSAEQLAQPTAENWQAYAPTLGDVAPFAAWHEGYHGGQLSALRRGFGLGPAFG